jgi:hypothetical protein
MLLDAMRIRFTTSPSMREKRPARKQEIVLEQNFLDKEGSNFNVFDTFKLLEKGKKRKITTALMVSHHAGGDITNEVSADDSTGSEGSFPGGPDLGQLFCTQR